MGRDDARLDLFALLERHPSAYVYASFNNDGGGNAVRNAPALRSFLG